MKKKKTDYSILVNILFVLIVSIVCIFLYSLFGKKNPVEIVTEIKEQNNQKVLMQDSVKPVKTEENQTKTQKNLPPFQKYKFRYIYTLDIKGFINKLNFSVLLPVDDNEKQYISNMNISVKPSKIHNDGVNTIAEFNFENLTPQKINIIIEGIARVRTYNIKNAKEINKKLVQEKDLNKYLQPENLIESNDPYIKNIASKINGLNREEIVQNIYAYIQKNISYKIINVNIGAKKALQQKYGKCSEFAAAMVAICRAKNIPARMVIGNIAREQIPQHNWVEIWFDEYGWVAYDPTVQPVIVNVYQNGKLLRQEKKYTVSLDDLRYIISGRNKFSLYNVKYSASDSNIGKVNILEQIEINAE